MEVLQKREIQVRESRADQGVTAQIPETAGSRNKGACIKPTGCGLDLGRGDTACIRGDCTGGECISNYIRTVRTAARNCSTLRYTPGDCKRLARLPRQDSAQLPVAQNPADRSTTQQVVSYAEW